MHNTLGADLLSYLKTASRCRTAHCCFRVGIRGVTALFVYVSVFCVSLAEAQSSPDEIGASSRRNVSVVAIANENVPVIDGDVLNDSAWDHVKPTSGFWQIAPDEGEPASERTEVRVIYTSQTLYFGVVCYDRDPGSIIVSDSRRDASLEETDSFQIILDTYLDTQNGFVFGTNPAGIEYDGQVTNEGQGSGRFGGGGSRPGGQGGQQRGAGGGFNLNWDAAWEVQTQISEIGWTAEFAIPFRTIRYPSVDTLQTWGINFQRNIRRRNETAFWSQLPRQYNLYRLSLAGLLTGLKIDKQVNFQITPYLLGDSITKGEKPRATDFEGSFGLDAKYSLTPSLTLDATYNTDFAQVEVDEQQINLDRFNLFFPEKRPFFLENAGFFTAGAPSQIELFFSRRIGISDNGEAIPIVAGAKVSGKSGGNNIGLLNMQTKERAGVSPANNFSVARVSRELANRSSIGGIFVNRQATGDLAASDDYNRTFGFDGRLGIGEAGLLSGFVARTMTPGLEGDDHAYRIRANRSTRSLDLNFGYAEVGENFNPEVGFLSREGYRSISTRIMSRIRPEGFFGLQEWRPHISWNAFWDFNGFQESGFVHIDQHLEFKAGHELHTGTNLTREGVGEQFEISDGVFVPPGTYDHQEAIIVFFTNEGAPFSFRFYFTGGGFFGGDRIRLGPSVRLRLGDSLNAEMALDRNNIDLPGGSFVANLVRARVSYSFTPRIFTQGLLQYNDSADIWSTNVRLGWLQKANTGLFIVYNDTRGLPGLSNMNIGGHSLTIKFSRLFDLAH